MNKKCACVRNNMYRLQITHQLRISCSLFADYASVTHQLLIVYRLRFSVHSWNVNSVLRTPVGTGALQCTTWISYLGVYCNGFEDGGW